VLLGLDVASGTDGEGAAAAVWLESRGLYGLRLFDEEIRSITSSGIAAAPRLTPGIPEPIDMSGLPTLLALGNIFECVCARVHKQGESASVTLHNVMRPLWALPIAEKAAGSDYQVRLTCGNDDDAHGFVTLNGAVAYRGVVGAAERETTRSTTLSMECVCLASAKRPHSELVATDLLLQRHRKSLRDGIAIDTDVWTRLKQLAGAVLVPASTESRRHGAGALIDDSA
jgi:hypothetical protein